MHIWCCMNFLFTFNLECVQWSSSIFLENYKHVLLSEMLYGGSMVTPLQSLITSCKHRLNLYSCSFKYKPHNSYNSCLEENLQICSSFSLKKTNRWWKKQIPQKRFYKNNLFRRKRNWKVCKYNKSQFQIKIIDQQNFFVFTFYDKHHVERQIEFQ